MPKLLLVEDEPELSRVIIEWLTDELHAVDAAFDGEEAWTKLQQNRYDLIVLDVMLPKIGGLEICQRYRQTGGDTPIIMLTAKRSLADKEAGLDIGADDYITKPFKLRELSARIRAILRRPRTVLPTILIANDLKLDTASRKVTRGESQIKLLAKEFALLELLLRNGGQVLSVDYLIDHAWTDESDVSPDTVRSYIRSLRQKLDKGESSSLIQNVHGMGYKIESVDEHP